MNVFRALVAATAVISLASFGWSDEKTPAEAASSASNESAAQTDASAKSTPDAPPPSIEQLAERTGKYVVVIVSAGRTA
jgi:hypothetical protein